MNPRDLDLLRSLISSLMGTVAAIDGLLNPEPEEAPTPDPTTRRPRLAYLGEDDPPPAA